MAISKSKLEQKAKEATTKRKSPADSIIDVAPVDVIKNEVKKIKDSESKIQDKHSYSFRMSDDLFIQWRAYCEAKINRGMGNLTEIALKSFMENNALTTEEKKLYDLELEKQRTKRNK